MANLILRILFPGYFEYQEQMNKQIKNLERECAKNER